MRSTSVYDLCRVLVDQAKALEENLSRFDDALETMDDDGVAVANRNIEVLASVMECLSGEVADTLDPNGGERDYDAEADDLGYGEDELPW